MIKSFRVRNFKSLGDVTVEFDPLTVLIGRSGTGKSNIIGALRYLRNYLRDRNDTFARGKNPESWRNVISSFANDLIIRFSVVFTVPGVEGDYYYDLALNLTNSSQGHNARVEHEVLSLDGNVILRQIKGQWEAFPQNPTFKPPSLGQLGLGLFKGESAERDAYIALTAAIGCYDFPSTVLADATASSGYAQALEDDGGNYLRAFELLSTDVARVREIGSALRLLSPSFHTLDVDVVGRQQMTVSQRIGSSSVMSLPLSEASEGFRRFLAHLIALYQVPQKQVLAFEEPEKGIFAAALVTLAEHFRSAAESGRSQIILTTHNPILLDHFPIESVRVVEIQDYHTRVGPVSPSQLDAVKATLLTPGELLTVDTARIDDPEPTPQ